MLKMQEILYKISMNKFLMERLQNTKNVKEIYQLCKEVEPQITENELEMGIQNLIVKSMTLNDNDLESVSGGKMNFNRAKSLLILTLMSAGLGLKNENVSAANVSCSTSSFAQTVKTEQAANKVTADGQSKLDTALLDAVFSENEAEIKKLLKQGANINAGKYIKVDDKSVYRTPLSLASQVGNLNLVILLLQEGAMIHEGYEEALRLAAENGYVEIVSYLLDNGATSFRDEILKIAVCSNQADVVKFLLKKGFNARYKDYWTRKSVLMTAAESGNATIVKHLLAYNASVFAKDNTGKTAYDYAKNDEIRTILKEAEKDVGFFTRFAAKINNVLKLDFYLTIFGAMR